MKVIRREPSVNDYNIKRELGKGKFRANFNIKGKMFNEIETDILFTPSP